ncbi:MAG: hypothetical protein R2844_04315 [Caldilineales bacterium]
MLNISCTYCRSPINISDGELAIIMQEAGGTRPKSAPVTCPNCRKTNKVPFKRLAQAYKLAGSPPPPVEEETGAADESAEPSPEPEATE